MTTPRKHFSADFKTKVALEAIKGQKTLNELAATHGVHPSQITNWKKQVLDEIPAIFSNRRVRDKAADEELQARLYQEIGQLKVELDWLKKKL